MMPWRLRSRRHGPLSIVVLAALAAFSAGLLLSPAARDGKAGAAFVQATPNRQSLGLKTRSATAGLLAGSRAPLPSPAADGVPELQPERAGRAPTLPLFAAVACAAVALASTVIRRAKGKPFATTGIRVRNPICNSLKNATIATFEELTTRKRFEPLVMKISRDYNYHPGGPCKGWKASLGKHGRTAGLFGGSRISRKKPHAKRYRIIDFGRRKRGQYATIEEIMYDPFRNARVALLRFEDGEFRLILHALGYAKGMQIISDEEAPPFVGNALPLKNVPIGTLVHNVEFSPGCGGAIARSAGTSCLVLAKDDEFVTIKMQSGEVRLLPQDCWCTVGRVGRIEANAIKLGKAGKRWYSGFRPSVRGKAKNACDHPHGGGEGHSHIGHKYPMDPKHRCNYGRKTRKANAASNKFILIKRKSRTGRK